MSLLLNILSYFFDPAPTGDFKLTYIFLFLAIIAFIGGVAFKFYLKKRKDDKIYRKLFKKLPGTLFLFAFIELVYYLARFERMPYLSMRFLNDIALVWGIYLCYHYVQIYTKVYPSEKKHHAEQIQKNKYLPRKHSGKK